MSNEESFVAARRFTRWRSYLSELFVPSRILHSFDTLMHVNISHYSSMMGVFALCSIARPGWSFADAAQELLMLHSQVMLNISKYPSTLDK